jgi:hypothetical protein
VRVGIIALCYHSQLIKSDSTMTIRHGYHSRIQTRATPSRVDHLTKSLPSPYFRTVRRVDGLCHIGVLSIW